MMPSDRKIRQGIPCKHRMLRLRAQRWMSRPGRLSGHVIRFPDHAIEDGRGAENSMRPRGFVTYLTATGKPAREPSLRTNTSHQTHVVPAQETFHPSPGARVAGVETRYQYTLHTPQILQRPSVLTSVGHTYPAGQGTHAS